MKIVKINQKPQDTLYTPVRSLMDDFFNYPLTRWDDLFLRDFDNLSANIWEEDIKISVTGDSLSIEGNSKEQKEEKEKKYFLKTFQSFSYSQSFNLPSLVNPDSVEATFEDGVLVVKLPKAKESETKQISIK